MAKIRDLKKIVNNELATVIESCYFWQLINVKDAEKADKVIDESIEFFDKLIVRINENDIKNKKSHFQTIKVDLGNKVSDLLNQLSKL